MKAKRALPLLLFFTCSFSNMQAQNNALAKVEAELLSKFKKIAEWRFSDADNADDSLTAANLTFKQKLNQALSRYPATISLPFKGLEGEGLIIATSPDNALRIYSWDTWTGGTMHFYENLFQYKSNGLVKSLSLEDGEIGADPKSYYYYIGQFEAGNETIYVAIDYSIYSGRDKGSRLQLFKIENGQLKNANIIKTSRLTNSIQIFIDATKLKEKMEFPEFKFDAATKTIFVPLIYDDDTPSGKFIRYRFDGKYFQKVKV